MSEEETAVVEEPVVDDREKRAGEFFDKLMNKPAETEQVETDADDVVEEQQPETPEPPKVEGPSVAMKLLAKQQGVDEDLLALARDDEQVQLLMDKLAKSREVEPEPKAPEEFVVDLPEDEFPADDPMRKQMESMADYVSRELKQMKSDMGLVAKYLTEQMQATESVQQQQIANEQGMFDAHLDAFEHELLGNMERGTHNHDFREAIYQKYWTLRQEKPTAKPADLIMEAAAKFGLKPKSTIRTDAIREANKSRLGGGPARAVPPREPTRDERFNALMDRLEARNQ